MKSSFLLFSAGFFFLVTLGLNISVTLALVFPCGHLEGQGTPWATKLTANAKLKRVFLDCSLPLIISKKPVHITTKYQIAKKHV